MENAAPYEIIAAPFEVYAAPVGTAFPAVDETPGAPWALLGVSGPDNFLAAGVTVEHSETLNFFHGLRATGPRKAFRSAEDMKLKFEIADLTLETYSLALNSNPVTPTAASAGVAGIKSMGLRQGSTVRQTALLVRGPSPYMADGVMQYEVPVASQSGNPSPVYKNDAPAGLAFEYTVMEDPDAISEDVRFGTLVAQTDVAES